MRARDYAPAPPGGPRGPGGRARRWIGFVPIWAFAVFAGTAYGAGWLDGLWAKQPAGTGTSTTAVQVTFGLCHTGGGRNCVVDGDTIWMDRVKIRIAGIDAPETHTPRCAREGELGEAATRRLRALLNSGAVTTSSIDRDEDSYGRKLRNVQVNGADVGGVLVGEGLARWYGTGRRSWC